MEEYMWNFAVLTPTAKEVVRSLNWERVGSDPGLHLMDGEAEIGHLSQEEVAHMVGYLLTNYSEQVAGGAHWAKVFATKFVVNNDTIRVITTLVKRT